MFQCFSVIVVGNEHHQQKVILMIKNIIVSSILVASCVACSDPSRFAGPIGEFRAAAIDTRDTVRPLLANVNHLDREQLIQDALADGSEVNGQEFAAPQYAPEDIAARIAVLDLVDLYTMRLAQLADADSNETLDEATGAIGDNLRSLGERIEALGLSEGTTAKNLAAPLSSAFGFVADLWISKLREDAIRETVSAAAPAIDSVLALLQSDLEGISQVREENAYEAVAQAVEQFNGSSGQARQRAANSALALARDRDRLGIVPPHELLKEMRTAHQALVDSVAQPDDDARFETAIESIRIFAGRAREAFVIGRSFAGAFNES